MTKGDEGGEEGQNQDFYGNILFEWPLKGAYIIFLIL